MTLTGVDAFLAEEKTEGRLIEVTVTLGAFGSLSWKPLCLKGSWPGLKYLAMIDERMKALTKNRERIQISKPSGK